MQLRARLVTNVQCKRSRRALALCACIRFEPHCGKHLVGTRTLSTIPFLASLFDAAICGCGRSLA
jgi:DMSO/TMAO reductase YedYZ heme-binding membrane subunit